MVRFYFGRYAFDFEVEVRVSALVGLYFDHNGLVVINADMILMWVGMVGKRVGKTASRRFYFY